MKNTVFLNLNKTKEYCYKVKTATTCRDHSGYWPTNENNQKFMLINYEIIRTRIPSSVESARL